MATNRKCNDICAYHFWDLSKTSKANNAVTTPRNLTDNLESRSPFLLSNYMSRLMTRPTK